MGSNDVDFLCKTDKLTIWFGVYLFDLVNISKLIHELVNSFDLYQMHIWDELICFMSVMMICSGGSLNAFHGVQVLTQDMASCPLATHCVTADGVTVQFEHSDEDRR